MSDVKMKWPREIWAAERGEYDQDGRYVFSEHATVPRWKGDSDCDFHRYVDGDIHDSAEAYCKHQIEAERTKVTDLLEVLEKWVELIERTRKTQSLFIKIEANSAADFMQGLEETRAAIAKAKGEVRHE